MSFDGNLYSLPPAVKQRNVIRFYSTNYTGYGSVNTCVPYWASGPDQKEGSAMTVHTNDAIYGLTIKILEDGVYFMTTYADQSNLGSFPFGITLNGDITTLTNNVESDATGKVLVYSRKGVGGGGQGFGPASVCHPLRAGDLINPQSNAVGANQWIQFSIVKIA